MVLMATRRTWSPFGTAILTSAGLLSHKVRGVRLAVIGDDNAELARFLAKQARPKAEGGLKLNIWRVLLHQRVRVRRLISTTDSAPQADALQAGRSVTQLHASPAFASPKRS